VAPQREDRIVRYRRFVGRYVSVVTFGPPAAGDFLRSPRPAVAVAPARWRPATDVFESRDHFTVTVEIPGVDPEALDVQLFEDALVVEGERSAPCSPDGVYHNAEIRQGRFRVEVALPAPVDSEGIVARYERGLLQITLPRPKPAPAGGGPG
jgi:HSP20 family protein